MRVLPLVVSLAAAVALATGCIKLKDRTMLLPDGSGRIAMRVGMSNAALEASKNLTEEESFDFAAEQLKALRNDWEGFTAFTRPVKSVDGDWTYVSFDAYFADLNAVKIWKKSLQSGKRELEKTFEVERIDGGGLQLTLRHKVLSELTTQFGKLAAQGQGEITDEQMADIESTREMYRSTLDGLELDFVVEMPGDVVRASGFTRTTGGTSTLRVTLDDLLDPKKVAKLAETDALVVRCGPSTWEESDLADFREQTEKAKADWKKFLADLEKKEAGK